MLRICTYLIMIGFSVLYVVVTVIQWFTKTPFAFEYFLLPTDVFDHGGFWEKQILTYQLLLLVAVFAVCLGFIGRLFLNAPLYWSISLMLSFAIAVLTGIYNDTFWGGFAMLIIWQISFTLTDLLMTMMFDGESGMDFLKRSFSKPYSTA